LIWNKATSQELNENEYVDNTNNTGSHKNENVENDQERTEKAEHPESYNNYYEDSNCKKYSSNDNYNKNYRNSYTHSNKNYYSNKGAPFVKNYDSYDINAYDSAFAKPESENKEIKVENKPKKIIRAGEKANFVQPVVIYLIYF